MIKVNIPATSANVGLGFDCMGIAFSLYATISFQESDTFQISGCDVAFQTKDNLVYTSFLRALEVLGKKIEHVHIHMDSDIPLSRGLGSSATCVVGGVVGAYALCNIPLDKEAIFSLCSDIEGHPDNVAPAIFGGLQASYMDKDNLLHVEYPIHSSYRFMAMIPDFKTQTTMARQVLPKDVPFSLAVHQSSKLALSIKAWETYNVDLLHTLMNDELHEPFRKQLIHEYEEVKDICRTYGAVCTYISGSGPTMIQVLRNDHDATQCIKEIEALTSNWSCIEVFVDTKGVTYAQ